MAHRTARLGMVTAAAVVLAAGLTAPAAADPLAEFHDQRADWHQCQEPPPPDPSEEPDDGIIVDP